METGTRYEVQRLCSPDTWGPLFGEGPVRFDDATAAEKERCRVDGPTFPCRVVAVSDVLTVRKLDLEEFVVPLVAGFWRLHAPGTERGHALEVILDKPRREQVRTDWARLSGWGGQPIYFAPEVELPGLRKRFPWARPRNVASVLRLLTLHELAHYVHGHNGLAASLRHRGSREALAAKFATMEAKADEITRVWWRDGLSRVNVPIRKEYEPAAVPRRRRRAA